MMNELLAHFIAQRCRRWIRELGRPIQVSLQLVHVYAECGFSSSNGAAAVWDNPSRLCPHTVVLCPASLLLALYEHPSLHRGTDVNHRGSRP